MDEYHSCSTGMILSTTFAEKFQLLSLSIAASIEDDVLVGGRDDGEKGCALMFKLVERGGEIL